MDLLYRVIFASACKSTHHKLAMDALCQLRGPAIPWRPIFLRDYEAYLEGSKAPDKQFKDFRNHVLHVRDNYWGGATSAARDWYQLTVDALRQRYWRIACYNAGVLSHYYTDPIQPFHTGQSTAESNIHRAAEWSITKSYDELRDLLIHRFGHPVVEVPAGDDWLEQMVRAGAEEANPHYEALIDHYDIGRGVKDSSNGYDAEGKEILARLIGYATTGFARILERAIDEADVRPPDVDLTLTGFLSTLKIPVHWITRHLEDARERELVVAMYDELQSTGRVEKNLSEDDRTVRELHAAEVLSGNQVASAVRFPTSPRPNHTLRLGAKKKQRASVCAEITKARGRNPN